MRLRLKLPRRVSEQKNRAAEIVASSIALQPTLNPILSAARFEIVARRVIEELEWIRGQPKGWLKLAHHNHNLANSLPIGQPLYRVGTLFKGETLGDSRLDFPLLVVRQ